VISVVEFEEVEHTIYTRNNMGHKYEGNCGFWVLNEMIKKAYREKIVGGSHWEPFGNYMLNSKGNPAQFEWK
jgi:hypothetical protein